MGGTAAALRARALCPLDGDEPPFRPDGHRRRRPQGVERRLGHARRLGEARGHLYARLRRARLGGGRARTRAWREAAARTGPLRPDDQPLRLVCVCASERGRGALADHRQRRTGVATKLGAKLPPSFRFPPCRTGIRGSRSAIDRIYLIVQLSNRVCCRRDPWGGGIAVFASMRMASHRLPALTTNDQFGRRDVTDTTHVEGTLNDRVRRVGARSFALGLALLAASTSASALVLCRNGGGTLFALAACGPGLA